MLFLLSIAFFFFLFVFRELPLKKRTATASSKAGHRTKHQSESNVVAIIIYTIIGALILSLLLIAIQGSSSNRHTDGVYESATEKMDKGIPLNEREQKRIQDILRYDESQRGKAIEDKNGER